MKFKSKISYLGEKNCILAWQMTEQLAVEFDVKNVMDGRTYIRNTQDKLIYSYFQNIYLAIIGICKQIFLALCTGVKLSVLFLQNLLIN